MRLYIHTYIYIYKHFILSHPPVTPSLLQYIVASDRRDVPYENITQYTRTLTSFDICSQSSCDLLSARQRTSPVKYDSWNNAHS